MVITLLSRFGSASPSVGARLLGALALLTALACGAGPEETIDRQVFIDTWVELRIAALETDTQRIAPADREAILERQGVTAEDLTRFVDTHATDLDFMRDIWNDVELRMDRPVGN